MRHCLLSCFCSLITFSIVVPVSAQVTPADATATTSDTGQQAVGPLQYIAPKSIEMRVGVQIQAGNGNMVGTVATTVFPTNWPEQTVEIVETNVLSPLRHTFRDLPGGNQQLLVTSSVIPARRTLEAVVRVRIEKRHIVGPEDTTHFIVPRRLPKDVKMFLGNSPYIEADNATVRRIVSDVRRQDPLTEWKKIEMLYDWVRENLKYERGELKTVREALRDGTGDCEEMTSTFVALCRAARVPARCVWIPNHCYPEFYMEDGQGNGYWFPCQVAGTRNFGSMPEYLPILQKGDRFKVPEKPTLQRYLADHLAAKKITGSTDPKVSFIRQLLGDAAQLSSPDLDGAANPSN